MNRAVATVWGDRWDQCLVGCFATFTTDDCVIGYEQVTSIRRCRGGGNQKLVRWKARALVCLEHVVRKSILSSDVPIRLHARRNIVVGGTLNSPAGLN